MAPRGILQHAVPDAATDGLGDGGAIGLGAEPKTPNGKVTPSPTAPRATPAAPGCPLPGRRRSRWHREWRITPGAASSASSPPLITLGLRPSSATCLRKALPLSRLEPRPLPPCEAALSFISLASWWNLASASACGHGCVAELPVARHAATQRRHQLLIEQDGRDAPNRHRLKRTELEPMSIIPTGPKRLTPMSAGQSELAALRQPEFRDRLARQRLPRPDSDGLVMK